MGMASSSYRLLSLTNRKNDIGLELMRCSNQKSSLARDSQKVAREYQDAVNAKTLKWMMNSGADYVDLSYSSLMTPGTINQNNPYLITDLSGRVVVDNKYLDYAKMISPDGKPVTNYEEAKYDYLSQATGIDADKIRLHLDYNTTLLEMEADLAALKSAIPEEPYDDNISHLIDKIDPNGDTYEGKELTIDLGDTDNDKIIEFLNSITGLGDSTADAALNTLFEALTPYLPKANDEIEHENSDGTKTTMPIIQSIKTILVNELRTTMTAHLNKDGKDGNLENHSLLRSQSGDGDKYYLNWEAAIDFIISSYNEKTGSKYSGTEGVYWIDPNSEEYQNYQTAYGETVAEYEEYLEIYNTAVEDFNMMLSAEEESLIEYYDGIFSSIAEMGWTFNNEVNNKSYFDQMLINNQYTITTVNRNLICEEKKSNNKTTFTHSYSNEYDSDIVSNFTSIAIVNDSDAAALALSEYEYQKSIISDKEARIDNRMNDLKTEQQAINTMIQGIQTVMKENTERTMNIFG